MKQKRKSVSWDSPAIKDVEGKVTPLQKKSKAEDLLTEQGKQLASEVDTYLKLDLIELLIYKLKQKQIKQKKLVSFLKEINYQIFNWALEHNNVALLNYLLSNLTENDAFLMLYNNAITIQSFLTSLINETELDRTRSAFIILEAMLKIQPNWLNEIVKDCLLHQTQISSLHSPTIEKLTLLIDAEEAEITSNKKLTKDASYSVTLFDDPHSTGYPQEEEAANIKPGF